MWSCIKKKDVDAFLNQYPILRNGFSKYTLIETDDEIVLPRLFHHNYPSQYIYINYGKNKPIINNNVNIKFKGELRQHQQEAISAVLNIYNLQKTVNGILKLYPSAGKTVLSIYLAARLGLKTIIIVDDIELMKQWINRIIQFSNLTIDDIGIIQQKIINTAKPICVAMAQTLFSRIKNNFNTIFKKIDDGNYELVIYDEVHTTSSSEMYSKVSVLFRTSNIIGLSATPFQDGVAEILMKNTVGEILYENSNYDLIPEYWLFNYSSGIKDLIVKETKTKTGHTRKITLSQAIYISKKLEFKRGLYNKWIINSNQYLEIIKQNAINIVEAGHVVMIMCLYKDQIKKISETLGDYPHVRYYGDERKIDFDKDNLAITTTKFFGKAKDWPRLSAMFIVTPLIGKKSVIQIVGRILRTYNGKLNPIVVDLNDTDFPSLFNPHIKRKIIENEFRTCKVNEY